MVTGVSCQVTGIGRDKRQEAVERCKGAKVERWKSVGVWTSGRVDRAEANKSGAVVIIYLGGVEFFFANAIEQWCEELPKWFRNNQ